MWISKHLPVWWRGTPLRAIHVWKCVRRWRCNIRYAEVHFRELIRSVAVEVFRWVTEITRANWSCWSTGRDSHSHVLGLIRARALLYGFVCSPVALQGYSCLTGHSKLPLGVSVCEWQVCASSEVSRVYSCLSPSDCWDRLQPHWTLIRNKEANQSVLNWPIPRAGFCWGNHVTFPH